MHDSDFLRAIRILRKRLWLIILIFLVTMGVIFYTQLTSGDVYQAAVRLQVLAAEPGEVGLFSTFRALGTSDEIIATQNEFISVLQAGFVAWETVAKLNLKVSAAQLLDQITVLRDADFITMIVQAATPQEAEGIAATHVENALAYYKTVRSRPASASKEFLTGQLEEEGKRVREARSNFLSFRLAHGLDSVPRELSAYQDLIRTMKTERDQAYIQAQRASKMAEEYRAAAVEAEAQADLFWKQAEEARKARIQHEDEQLAYLAREDQTGARQAEVAVEEQRQKEEDARADAQYYQNLARQYRSTAVSQDAVAEGHRAAQARYDQVIASLQTELSSLIGLSDEYDELSRKVTEALSSYDFVQSKLNEARLKENQVRNMGYIQIIEPARTPDRPLPSKLPQFALAGAVVSLLAGLVLSFVIEGLESLARPGSASRRAE
ncbi:MAG: GumC family protein [Anaerolineae bacterium]